MWCHNVNSTLHERVLCNLTLSNSMLHDCHFCRLYHYILAKSGIQIRWQSRGRGRTQHGPRPLDEYELGCIRFQLITRGAFRFHAKPGLRASGVQLGATQNSFYMVIYKQLSTTHELQSATQKPFNGCLSCAELRLHCA